MAKRISIINFKGGVGKTTLAFHLGAGLALMYNSRVLLVDMDHQSSLSVVCLRANKWREAVDNNRTVDAVFRPFIDDALALPGDEIIITAPMKNRVRANYDSMDILPASLSLDDTEIELTSTHQSNPIRSEWNKRTLICRWIEETGVDDEYDYIIFDCPPATKIVSQNAIAASHGYIIPVVPEAVMERGAPHLYNMMSAGIDMRLKAFRSMGEPRAIYVPDTKLVGLVVTRIERARGMYSIIHRTHLQSLQNRWRDDLLRPYIYDGTGVASAVSVGLPVYNPNTVHNWDQNIKSRGIDTQFLHLTYEIKRRIDAL